MSIWSESWSTLRQVHWGCLSVHVLCGAFILWNLDGNVVGLGVAALLWMLAALEANTITRAELAARDTFCATYPSERVSGTRLAANEAERWVVGVFYGNTRPGRFKFYAVRKSDHTVHPLEDPAPYAPKLWR